MAVDREKSSPLPSVMGYIAKFATAECQRETEIDPCWQTLFTMKW